ncbi:sodium:calcium antiporter [Candidatus Roizmanbacteria bacterium]|nr:sodium:calcium antiporter [Candidatus Roizmanbacteria bacterium]
MNLFVVIASLFLSILMIGKGSDWFTDSLIPLARRLGVSRVAVGLILVSIAVSLPEILVVIYGVIRGHPSLSLGVALGSIICNIGLMTGLSALIRPLRAHTYVILRDGIFSVVTPILVFAVASGGVLTRLEGLAFMLLFIPYVVNVFMQEKLASKLQKERDYKEIEIKLELLGFEFANLKSGWTAFLLGLVLLILGAQFFITTLIQIVGLFSLNEVVVGLTIGAIGPSIPNILAAYKATKRGMGDVAVSETLGSNIFTLLVTMGLLAFLSPIAISQRWIYFDIPIMIVMSLMLFLFMLTRKTISRFEGSVLLGVYILILVIQIAFLR